jgi:hypothetical protein
VKEWRRYRPNGIERGKDRLTALKRCREYHISKRARHTSQSKATSKQADTSTFNFKQLQVANPFCHSARYYDSIDCKGVPSHSSFPTLSQSSWNQSSLTAIPHSASLASGSTSDSEKEVVCTASTDNSSERRITSEELDIQHNSQTPTQTTPELNSNNRIVNAHSIQGGSHSEPRHNDEAVTLAVNDATQTTLNATAITRSSSSASRHDGASLRTMSTRISSRASISWSHISSVLAATLSSGFSQRYSASSSAVDVSRLDSTYTPWSRAEFESWNELVDESRLQSTSPHLPFQAGPLQQRPCCGLFETPPYSHTMGACSTCGYNGKFHLARHMKIPLFVSGSQDRLGTLLSITLWQLEI